MKWTSETPTKPGWYWIAEAHHSYVSEELITIVKIRDYNGKLCIANWPLPTSGQYRHVYWAGPIKKPEPKEFTMVPAPNPTRKLKRRKK